MPLISISCAWILGTFLGSKFNLSPLLVLTALVPLPLFFLLRRHRQKVIVSVVCLVALFAAATYSYTSLHTFDETSLRFHNDRGTVTVKGIVARDPDVRDTSTRLNLSATEIKLGDDWQAVDGTALVVVPRYPEYRYGDRLLITGELATPPQLDDFDYREYLAHQGIYATMLYPEIETIEREKGSALMSWVYSVRSRISHTIAGVIPEPQASLAQAILLGIRGNIPPELKADFVRSGTAHLLAISGLHLSIIVGILLSAGIWLFGRRYYLYVWLALVVIWLYVLLTGMHPPVVRGAIMASLFLFAELLGRQRRAITALVAAAAIMVGISPYILGDAAFQLSFLAMAGLVFLFPAFQSLGRRAIRATLGEAGTPVALASTASDSFSATLAALIAVWPAIAYYFGIISVVGPLATLLLLPALPAIIITGALTGVLGFIMLPAAQAIGWLSWLFLSYSTVVVGALATPPPSSIEVNSVPGALICAYYAVLAAIIWLLGRRRLTVSFPQAAISLKKRIGNSASFVSRLPARWTVPPLVVLAILASLTAVTMPDNKLHVSFLDVGQGDAILIRHGTQQVLVDGGPSPRAITGQLGNQMPFWDRTIELLVLTHPHQDHLSGLVEVLQRFRVKQVLMADCPVDSPLYNQWWQLITEKDIKYTIARAGQQAALDEGITLTVLHPPAGAGNDTGLNQDNKSVVLRLTDGKVSFLLTGDILADAERELVGNRANLRSTVLKVPHHGAATSTTPEFLAVVNPRLAVISVGADNRFNHPGEEVMVRLQDSPNPRYVYRTDQHGVVEFTTDGERLWVATEKNAD